MDYPVYEDKRSTGFATAALVLGICGLAAGCCLYIGIICGALAIIFSLLSRGGEMTMSPRAKAALALGIAAVTLSILLFLMFFAIMLIQYGGIEGYMEYYNELLQQMESGYTYPYY